MVITFLLNNDPKTNPKAEQWELKYLELIQNQKVKLQGLVNISYSAERSVQVTQ
jgi:hypothetical protein